MRFQFSGIPQKRGFGCTCVLCLPRPEWFRQPEVWGHSPRMRRAFSLRGPSAHCRSVPTACVCSEELASSCDPPGSGCRPSKISVILQTGTGGRFAMWEGVASLGLNLPLSPPPCLLPPVGMGQLFSGVSQSLCFANRWQCVFGPVNFLPCLKV